MRDLSSSSSLLLFLLSTVLVCLIGRSEAWLGGISRTCECKAVSDTVHYPFHTWKVSSCRFCSCSNPAMANCEQACEDMVRNYAKTGCGRTVGGSKTVAKYDAGGCGKRVGSEVHVCA